MPTTCSDHHVDSPGSPCTASSCAELEPDISRPARLRVLGGMPGRALLALAFLATPVHALPSKTTLSLLSAPALRRSLSSLAVAASQSTCACTTAAASTGTAHDSLFAVRAAMIPLIVILSGILAGLTLGYMSLDATQLQVLSKTGSPKQKAQANRVLPLLKNRHLLLITLLLSNMLLNEILPVLADSVLGGGVQAVIVSTVLVVIFSEIIPQSVCSTFGLAIGSAMVWPVQILIWTFFIFSWPVAWLLNWILGEHSGVVYRRTELKELINLHGDGLQHGGDLHRDTITIVGSALDFQAKTVSSAMTRIDDVFMLPIDSKLDFETMGRILKSGHSRIPIYEMIGERKRVVSVLLTKQLILVDPEDGIPLRLIPMNSLPLVPDDLPLLDLLNTFQEGKSHMAIVAKRRNGFGAPSSLAIKGFSTGSSGDASDSDMERGEVAPPHSLLKSLFRRKKSDEKVPETVSEKDAARTDAEQQSKEQDWLDARASRSSLTALYLDEEQLLGLITLEDLIEQILGEAIWDETDRIGAFAQPWVKAYIPPEAFGRVGFGPALVVPVSAVVVDKPAAAPKVALARTVDRLKGMARSRSAPGKVRKAEAAATTTTEDDRADKPAPPTILSSSIVAEPATLPNIREQSSSGSGSEDDGADEQQLLTQSLIAPSTTSHHTRQSSEPSQPTTSILIAPVATSPLAPESIILGRGRLTRLATDPTLALRIARSAPATRAGTPILRSGTPPGPKGAFKSPALGALPIRAAAPIVVEAATVKTPEAQTEEPKADEEKKEL